MPFIDNSFKVDAPSKSKRILITCADNSPMHQVAETLARFLIKQNQHILWIDGDLGNGRINNPGLSKILCDKGALPKAIKQVKHLSILGGKSDVSLAEKNIIFQQQFLSDLQFYEVHFDCLITSINGQNPNLQNLWLEWTDKTFLLFQNNNLSLEKTAHFLMHSHHQIHGMIGTGYNFHETQLAWIRLKKIVPDTPELISDITKITL